MSAISAFQRLPPHIAEKIAYYCVSTHLVSKHTDPDKCKEAKPTWTKLYDVSYLWRNLSLERFFKELTIVAAFGVGSGRLEFCNMPDEIEIDTVHYAYVKQVNIKFPDISNPLVKKATQDFSAVWPKTLVLRSARTLNIDLAALYYQEFDEYSAIRNERFFWITQRVKSSMPKLQKVTISDQPLVFTHRTDFSGQQWNADQFLATVFDRATSVSIDTVVVNLISNHTFIHESSRLTKLEYDCNGSEDELFGYILEKTAPTLESLCVLDYYATSVRLLVLSNSGKPIVYPRLQKLVYEGEDNTNPVNRCRVDRCAVPFPALRYLSWSTLYMFEDDTLFRGNSGTLEYMSIIVDDNCIDILQRHGVFGEGKYSRLKHVSLADSGTYYGMQQPLLVSDAVLSLAATVITPALEGLSLECEISYEALVGLIDSNPDLKNIQTLRLGKIALTLPKVVELVKRLPNMTRLWCDTIQGNQSHSLVNDMCTAQNPISQRLTFVDLSHVYSEDMEVVAKLSLILAIMCPRFVAALVPPDNADTYRDDIRKAVASGAYDDHGDKIQRFLLNTLSN
ncbi:hypothetical protein LPJ81_004044 [Coemansia sp. IMI 209127]|nr:hypothetical protein LPJ81_004044 [Coemansia sp. IMI 209127]